MRAIYNRVLFILARARVRFSPSGYKYVYRIADGGLRGATGAEIVLMCFCRNLDEHTRTEKRSNNHIVIYVYKYFGKITR